MELSVDEIARRIGGTVVGDGSVIINGLAGIEEAGAGEITFVANRKYLSNIETTKASAVIAGVDTESTGQSVLIHHKDPYFAFMQVVRIFHPPKKYDPFVHPTAVIAEDAEISNTAHIGPNVVIESGVRVGASSAVLAGTFVGENASIGESCLIYPNVTIRDHSHIGDRVIIHSGTVIGADGFGFATKDGVHHKIEQIGLVRIEDDVEIGANCTIDRAALGETVIGAGSKIDNLVMIAHNVKIGRGCIIVSQVGISGSTKLGDYVVLAGQAGLVGHIELGDRVIVAAQSGVPKDIPAGTMVLGTPAREAMLQKRIEACIGKLPDLVKRVRSLEKKLKASESDED